MANSTAILSWSILLFPAVFVVNICTFQRNRGQLINPVLPRAWVLASALEVAVAEDAGGFDSEPIVDLWTENFSSTSFIVIELMIP